MKLYTIQMGKWRLAEKLGVEVFNITVKNGNRHFAPTWKLLKSYKESPRGEDDIVAYKKEYRKLMNISVRRFTEEWEELCSRDILVIGCYCPDGDFCHRYELVKYLEIFAKYKNIPFEYAGELK